MSFRVAPALFAATAAIALASCGSNNSADQAATGNSYPVLEQPAGMSGLTLTAAQQQRRNALDMPSYERDYRTYYDQGPIVVTGDMPAPNATSTPTAAGNDTAATGGSMASGSTAGNTASGSMAANGAAGNGGGPTTSFAQLDRNHDGKLSVAEYAIYATDASPDTPVPNDQKKPYATAEQLNKAADGFFAYDTNGDSYLQSDEFAAAKAAGAGNR